MLNMFSIALGTLQLLCLQLVLYCPQALRWILLVAQTRIQMCRAGSSCTDICCTLLLHIAKQVRVDESWSNSGRALAAFATAWEALRSSQGHNVPLKPVRRELQPRLKRFLQSFPGSCELWGGIGCKLTAGRGTLLLMGQEGSKW